MTGITTDRNDKCIQEIDPETGMQSVLSMSVSRSWRDAAIRQRRSDGIRESWRRRLRMTDDEKERRLLPRLLSKILIDSSGCWLWNGSISPEGYARIAVLGKPEYAHIVLYMRMVGTIPCGLELDHLCRVRHCVNPAHLEPVTSRVNMLRGVGVTAIRAKQTHCKRGHEFNTENTGRAANGTRYCRICRLASRKGWS